MSGFVNIELDPLSVRDVNKSLRQYGQKAVDAIKTAVMRTALAIESDAKRRLNGQLGSAKHWVTGRLASSVHTEMEGLNSFDPIVDSKSGDESLGVPFEEMEGIVGTNVEYAKKIENDYDSFLRFACERQGKNFKKRVEQEMNKIK